MKERGSVNEIKPKDNIADVEHISREGVARSIVKSMMRIGSRTKGTSSSWKSISKLFAKYRIPKPSGVSHTAEHVHRLMEFQEQLEHHSHHPGQPNTEKPSPGKISNQRQFASILGREILPGFLKSVLTTSAIFTVYERLYVPPYWDISQHSIPSKILFRETNETNQDNDVNGTDNTNHLNHAATVCLPAELSWTQWSRMGVNAGLCGTAAGICSGVLSCTWNAGGIIYRHWRQGQRSGTGGLGVTTGTGINNSGTAAATRVDSGMRIRSVMRSFPWILLRHSCANMVLFSLYELTKSSLLRSASPLSIGQTRSNSNNPTITNTDKMALYHQLVHGMLSLVLWCGGGADDAAFTNNNHNIHNKDHKQHTDTGTGTTNHHHDNNKIGYGDTGDRDGNFNPTSSSSESVIRTGQSQSHQLRALRLSHLVVDTGSVLLASLVAGTTSELVSERVAPPTHEQAGARHVREPYSIPATSSSCTGINTRINSEAGSPAMSTSTLRFSSLRSALGCLWSSAKAALPHCAALLAYEYGKPC